MTGVTLFRKPCQFVFGAASLDGLPPVTLPEFAFIGRSNVGKSSLINAITGQAKLARTSHTPGRTQQLNFFNLAETLMIVDMPGYGYAKVSKKEREHWHHFCRSYLAGRSSLRCFFVLVDARRGLKDVDHDIMELADEAGVSCRVVLTKIDDIKKSEIEPLVEKTEKALKKHPSAFPSVILTSSRTKTGLEDVQKAMLTYLL